ncbi:MAG: alginate export family protein, partial [OM182 bacterium]|nr:alginate export family protein [OM182 bacterium]
MLSSFQIITCSFIVEFCRSRRAKSLLASVALASCALVSVPSSAADASAWRLDQSLDLPEGLSLSGAFRSRFENARNSVRSGTPNDQVLTLRTRIDARYKENGRVWQFEVMDARQQYADADGILGTGDVNALDIQQASVKLALGSEATTLK